MTPRATKPPRVGDHRRYWSDPPPEPSLRCLWWLELIQESGWRPNRRIGSMDWDCRAEFFGVWLWEYLNVLYPALVEAARRDEAATRAAQAAGGWN